MKGLIENWKHYLEEGQLEEKLSLKKGKRGWWKYSELVAEAYRTAPDYDSAVEPLYEKLGKWLEGMFGRMSSKIDIKFVPEHPYTSAIQMRQRVRDEGVMYVSTSDVDHPVWKGEQGLIWNTMFRAWHDWEGHIAKEKGFRLQGEIAAYNAHTRTIPRDCLPILFTEVVGQRCCFYQSGKKNCRQKAMIMPEFDYINVGNLTPEGEKRFNMRLNPQTKLLEPIGEKAGVNIDDSIENEENLNENEPWYKRRRTKDVKNRKELIGKGGNKHTGGGKGHSRPSMQSPESAPPGVGVLEEDEVTKSDKIRVKIKPKTKINAESGDIDEKKRKKRKKTSKKRKKPRKSTGYGGYYPYYDLYDGGSAGDGGGDGGGGGE